MTIGTTEITGCRIMSGQRSTHREAERQAVAALVSAVFGHNARLTHDKHGAPAIEGFKGHISISHTQALALIAVNNKRRIGIDIETWRASMPELARRFMTTDTEQRAYCRTPDLILQAWTTKEAVFKAAGSPGTVITDIILPADPQQRTIIFNGNILQLHTTKITLAHTLTLAETI